MMVWPSSMMDMPLMGDGGCDAEKWLVAGISEDVASVGEDQNIDDWRDDPLQDLGADEQGDEVDRRECDGGAENDLERE